VESSVLRVFITIALLVGIASCCLQTVTGVHDNSQGADAGADAGFDAGIDAGPDAGQDAGIDAGIDAGSDAGMDAEDGGLSAPMSYPTDAGEATSAAVGDLNGDGWADIAAIEIGNVIIFANDGDGGFATSMIPVPTGGSNGLFGIRIGDLNGDGLADIVANTSDGSQLAVLLNTADGGFSEVDYPTSIQTRGIASLSLGRSGAPDLVIGNPAIAVLRNDGRGAFTIEAVSGSPGFITSGDFNGDCVPDFAILQNSGCVLPLDADVSIFFGRSDGGFDREDIILTGSSPSWITAVGPVSNPRALALGSPCAGGGITVSGDASR